MKYLQVLQDICQTDWNFLLDRIKICRIDEKSCLLKNLSHAKGCTIFVIQTKFLLVKMKIWQFCQTVQQFLHRLRAIKLGDDAG